MKRFYSGFYKTYFPQLPPCTPGNPEVQVCCPFHDDHDPSMSINLVNGMWKCFGPCQEGGDAYAFYMKMHSASFVTAKRTVDALLKELGDVPDDGDEVATNNVVPISEQALTNWHNLLLRSDGMKGFLFEKRGFNIQIINKFNLGYDGNRLTIPIHDEQGLCVNVRRYLKSGKGSDKMINYRQGYGKARLWPLSALESEEILLCEGEMDTILANQKSFNAMTTTGGAGTWLMGWTPLFKDKIVYICYDCDKAGRDGAVKVAKAIHNMAKKVVIVSLPLAEPKGADLTDYFVMHGYTVDDFRQLMNNSPEFTTGIQGPVTDEDEEVIDVSLYSARLAKYRGKKVRMNVHVVGKDLAPYTIPQKMDFSCPNNANEDDNCVHCPLNLSGGKCTLELTPSGRLLNMIRCTDTQQIRAIKSWARIPDKCNKFSYKVEVPQNIEELLVSPELTYEDFDSSGEAFTLQKAYFIAGEECTLRPNQTYEMEGTMYPDPWQQYVTFVFTSARPLRDSIGNFNLSPGDITDLRRFQPQKGQSVKNKFDEIHDQFSKKVTRIYGRNDLLTAVDLVYHSVLQFTFQDVEVRKGWLECLIIGDTRTGKSESTEKIMAHYKIGEMVFGENASFAGLIGGMQQTQSRWFITWGKVPLNDRRLLVLDEASGISEEEISRMSGVRSSGIAEITKIQTEKALARTRMIWISNTRSGRPLKTYPHGVEAMLELIGKTEDVSRFDFAMTCASGEISSDIINSVRVDDDDLPLDYTSDMCRKLIMWAWSRKPADVIFDDDAVSAILTYAIAMGNQYSTRIPLVEPANQRIKLARMAVAVAARLFSTDSTATQVLVRKEHVDFAYDYISEIYSKPSMDYAAFSHQEKDNERVAAERHDVILKYIGRFAEIGELFIRQNYLRASDMEELLGIDKESVKDHIKTLASARMIDRTPHGYRKTPSFIMLLREWQNLEQQKKATAPRKEAKK